MKTNQNKGMLVIQILKNKPGLIRCENFVAEQVLSCLLLLAEADTGDS